MRTLKLIAGVCLAVFLSRTVLAVDLVETNEQLVWVNDPGDASPPVGVASGSNQWCAISAGLYHSMGLKLDGRIVGWGYNNHDQMVVPEPNADFIAVAAGSYHTLGLKADGHIVAWGDNSFGQTMVPEPNSDFVAIAAGVYHSLGLKSDGSIVAWGKNEDGQTNVPEPNMGFVAMAAGGSHTIGLKADGSVVGWGNNLFRQIVMPSPNTGFVAVAAGYYHSIGLKEDGRIVAWGNNSYKETEVPEPNMGFVAVTSGRAHVIGLKGDGRVVVWGDCRNGKVMVPEPNTNFVAVVAGDFHSLGLKADGSIVGWGSNQFGQTEAPGSNTDSGLSVVDQLGSGLQQGGCESVIGNSQVFNPTGLCATVSSESPILLGLSDGPSGIVDGASLTFTGVVSIVAWQSGDPCFNAEPGMTNIFTGASSLYPIAVGNGSGGYDSGAIVPISAVGIVSGYLLNYWMDDTQYVSTPELAATTVPMSVENDCSALIRLPQATQTAPVPVPYSWLDGFALVTGGDYEAAAVIDADGDGHTAWQEYVAGTSPVDETSILRTTIHLEAGQPVVSWEPDLGTSRVYWIEGRTDLRSGAWGPDGPSNRFFRVGVDLP